MMADMEKIIKALECCSQPAIRKCIECPYESYCYHDSLCDIAIHDALVLLKEQEAEIAFLKAMQLQTVHNMSNGDIGNAVRNVLRL